MFWATVEGDIPFQDTIYGGRLGPTDPDRLYLVDWAEGACRLRASPLISVDDPFAAASRALVMLMKKKEKFSGEYFESLNNHFQLQAWRMVDHLDAGLDPKVHWDQQRQEYRLAE